ncbi:hypothetical protein QR680_004765 [Steinernema hermaphroditum]|uniref:Uncharacterized protein n=1 Tax=Steinernema hermaphroditum TaxID=289476 RepID=A0AA39HRY6_9BILA|nr:hypothetical protein QR680_004765 [Steinernema hermaphroditum]
MARVVCENPPTDYFLPFILVIVYDLCVIVGLVIFLVINRKYLGAGAIRIRKEQQGTTGRSVKKSVGKRGDEVTDYDVTIAQTDKNTVG